MKNSKEWFAKAFMEAEKLDCLKLKSENETTWNFSEKFEKSMEKLIKKNRRISLSVRKSIRKIVLVVLILLFLLIFGCICFPVARNALIDLIKKLFKA